MFGRSASPWDVMPSPVSRVNARSPCTATRPTPSPTATGCWPRFSLPGSPRLASWTWRGCWSPGSRPSTPGNLRLGSPVRLQRAEQNLLLVRWAADSGARRGELAALRFDDLEGRVLHIERGVSAGVLIAPKSGQARRLTLGAHGGSVA